MLENSGQCLIFQAKGRGEFWGTGAMGIGTTGTGPRPGPQGTIMYDMLKQFEEMWLFFGLTVVFMVPEM